MSEDSVGSLRKMLAGLCHACPLCKFGREHPESILGRLLNHPLHADHCPMWKAEKERYGSGRKESTAI
jgi:hypothetical protein